MASLVLAGDTSGSITVAAPAVAGSNTQTLVAATGTLTPLISGTAITLTNQTAPAFTDIPSWVKRITLMFNALSTNSTGAILCQLGTGSTPTYSTSGYTSGFSTIEGTNATTIGSSTSGFSLKNAIVAADAYTGVITLLNITGNTWAGSSSFTRTSGGNGISQFQNGFIALGAALTAVRLYIDGTQQFDAGTINILYE